MARYGNCLVGQSGGPTAVINASACGVIKTAIKSPDIKRVFGANYGIEGILKDQIFDLEKEDEKEIELLKYTPASALGSCRYKLKHFSEDESEYEKIFSQFERYGIRYFFYIGGNDSMDTVKKLSEYAKKINYDISIIGIPKTIDNDLYGTDHTPGYGSAAKYIATCVMEIARDGDVYDKDIINVVEVMGRHAGWLAAASALARCDAVGAPDLIYFPEKPFELEHFMQEVEEVYRKKRKVTVVVAEGIRDKNGKYICELADTRSHDVFGNVQLGGVSAYLGSMIKQNICRRVKVIELNVMQRAAMHFVSKTDLEEAYLCGCDAVRYGLEGETGKMVTLERVSSDPYVCRTGLVSVSEVANRAKEVPVDWITPEGNFVTQEAVDYIKPLIQGEVFLPTENGLPRFAQLKKVKVQP